MSSNELDDLDDLFESISPTKQPTHPATAAAPASSTQQIEDELFEILNTPNDAMATPSHASTGVPSFEDTSDFLSWLEESPSKAAAAGGSSAKQSSADEDSASEVVAPQIHAVTDEQITAVQAALSEVKPPPVITTSSALSERSDSPAANPNDSFFQDVFGSERTPPRSPVVHHASSASQPSYVSNLEAILTSPFPDVGQLRGLVDEAGYLPGHLRAQVLLLLLTGSSLLDEEAQRYTSTTEEHFYPELCSDCTTLLQSVDDLSVDRERVALDMKDIIILYCQRRNLEYKNDFARILFSVIGTKHAVPKAVSSGLFYSLASSFMPLIGLQYTALELAVDVIHRWLRLLLLYHCPVLAQHLDRVLPGWEQPAKEASTTQTAKYSKLLAGTSNLDALERELGLDASFDYESEQSPVKEVAVIQSAHPKDAEKRGVIATSWLTSFFAGCMPANESAKVLDWAVFNGERFAGLYFVVSLLTLHSSTLLQMNSPALLQWFTDLQTNKKNWFRQCKVSPDNNDGVHAVASVDCGVGNVSWAAFTKGWIQATSVLVASTPGAFREALSRTETWAVLSADKQRAALSQFLRQQDSVLDDPQHGEFDIFTDKAKSKGKDKGAEESDDDASDEESNGSDGEEGEESKMVAKKAESESGLLTNASLLVKAIGKKLQGKGDDPSSPLGHGGPMFVQDIKRGSDTLSIWADTAEVVPCITSNQRRGHAGANPQSLDIRSAFCGTFSLPSSQDSDADRMGCCFFLTRGAADAPVFFGIDCRSEGERGLGLFPKAYAVDPDVITDGEALNDLMAVLQPLAATTHICVIGAGDDYYRWEYKQKNARKFRRSKKEPAELLAHITERRNAVNAVALYLIKKSFSHVSVLEGGFVEAIRFLSRHDSKVSLESALVDVQQRPQLYALLGIPMPVAAAKGSQRASIVGRIEQAWEGGGNIKTAVSSLLSTWSAPAGPTVAGTTPAPTAAPAAAESSAPSAVPPSTGGETKASLSGWSKLSLLGASSLDTLRRAVNANNPPVSAPLPSSAAEKKQQQQQFSIDEDEEDDGMGPRPSRAGAVQDTTTINISRTDGERAQALALHRMAGLKKGDTVTICRAELPGSVLFPAHKVKSIPIPVSSSGTEQDSIPADSVVQPIVAKAREVELPRYLVVSRERFLVLDAQGGGVGSTATVKSNRHLTELAKMTFRKKDPELATLHFLLSEGKLKPSQYRVKKHADFVKALQKNMERFK